MLITNYVFRASNSKIITGIKRETINYFQITGWVPLHEAAWKGHKDCAVALLNWDAPAMPRYSFKIILKLEWQERYIFKLTSLLT